METVHQCHICNSKFKFKSNLNRHMKIHEEKTFECTDCKKVFTLKQHLQHHLKQHQYPVIPLYNQHEAKLQCTKAAKDVAKVPKSSIDDVWLEPSTAEAKAKSLGHDLWRSQLVLTFGKYAGQTFKWLLENDVGWAVWLLAEFSHSGEKNEQLRWLKQQLLEFVNSFSVVQVHLEKRLKKEASKKEISSTTVARSDLAQDPGYVEDSELLSHAENVLSESDVPVCTHLTILDDAVPSSSDRDVSVHEFSIQDPDCEDSVTLDGWQKQWDQGITAPNMKWLKDCDEYGLFEPPKPYKNAQGATVFRKVFKGKMEFSPPPIPTIMKGSLPNMLSFFTTPVFFWRPVGVMEVKIKCPNANCPAPGAYLSKHGFCNVARPVCGLRYYYTILTERLFCIHCKKQRGATTTGLQDDGREQVQYSWLAYSPQILSSLAPAVRGMFPAVMCGKRAVDKNVVTLLSDRLSSVSMTKVHRILKQGHDEWYTERRDMYQTLLYQAHTASNSSQRGILSYIKPEGTYTPPLLQTPLPSPQILRKAHMLMEMAKLPDYRASILSVTGEILCIDGTKQILKKVYGDGRGTFHYLTSVLNEWGQFVTTILVASESEDCYRRMARGLIARYRRANVNAPKLLYTDNNCCRDGGASWYESLFADWVAEGLVIRLDIRHWLHRWDAVVIKQTHAKYGVFMSAMAGAILAYNREDLMTLVKAVRNGNMEMYSQYSDYDMLEFVKPHQMKSYVRRVTRGVEESASVIESILEEFKGPAGLDIDGIPLFKSSEAVDNHWLIASKHLSCMQDPPGVQLYVTTKQVTINGVQLNKYRCRRGSNSLEGLHAHMYHAVPSKRCGIMPFQVYLMSFAVQWNARMDALRVAGGQGRKTLCTDLRQIQRLNRQAEVLFGKDHLFEPNFAAPMPFPNSYQNPEEEELLGVEYAYCQSTDFHSKEYYVQKVDEEQSREVEEEEEEKEDSGEGDEESEDEGVVLDLKDTDPINNISKSHTSVTQAEKVDEVISPVLQDVLMAPRHLHLPGFEEVENLAVLLLQLADDSTRHIIPAPLREEIRVAALALHEHDKSYSQFTRKYTSKWGYSLFGRCLGPESPLSSAAQKTKFGWMRYAQAASITEESRLIYILIKMIKNRPPVNTLSSPSKVANRVKGDYQRIVDRVRDDPILRNLNIPLPNINAKSISSFLLVEKKKANYFSTTVPSVTSHRRVISESPMPDADNLPPCLPPPSHQEISYPDIPLVTGKRPLQKRKLDLDEPQPLKKTTVKQASAQSGEMSEMAGGLSQASSLSPVPPPLRPKKSLGAPVLLVVPAQPAGKTITFSPGASTIQGLPFGFKPAPAPPPRAKPFLPDKSDKPCSACKVPRCGGQRKRYTPSKDKTQYSNQKLFTFCPATGKSTTPGFDKMNFHNFEHFKEVVDKELEKRKNSNKCS